VVLLDVSGVLQVTDFMILATGTSPRQMKTACEDVQELAEPRGYRPLCPAADNENWNCIDLIDLVVHVFSSEARAYYDLDNLWGDARRVEWKNEAGRV